MRLTDRSCIGIYSEYRCSNATQRMSVISHPGRACAMQDDTAKALWKDADPDIPILKQAKAEYAKLR